MNMKKIVVIFFVAIGLFAHSQLPVNLIPNYNFEIGSIYADPSKQCYILDGKIDDWKFADPRPGFHLESFVNEDGVLYPFDECLGAGWTFQSLTANQDRWQVNYYDAPEYSNNYIFVENGNGRGIRALLNSPIVASESKKYFVRTKLYFDQAITNGYVAFHFTKYGEHWNDGNWRNRRMWDAIKFYCKFNQLIAPYSSETKWNVYEGVFTSTWDSRYVDELKNVIIVGGGMGQRSFAIDDVEIFEYCSENMLRQNRHYYLGKEQEEAGFITAGFQNATSAIGPVTIHSPVQRLDMTTLALKQIYAPQVIYKAEHEVILRPGFEVERGGEFTAKIAPCGSACMSSNVSIPTRYSICDNNCIKLNGGGGHLMTYSWSSSNPDFMQYLSDINSNTPTFCPPSTRESGTFSYTVTITNTCGESTTKTVYIHYDENSNPNPEFTAKSSDLVASPNKPSFTVEVGPHTEFLYFEIRNCSNTLLKRYKFEKGVNLDVNMPLNWQLNDFFPPCDCYKIVIRSKNICYTNWHEQTYDWQGLQGLTNLVVGNITICEGGKRKICFSGTGISAIGFELFNRWDDRVMDYHEESFTNSPFCMEVTNNIVNGQYKMYMTFIGCDGSRVDRFTWVTVFNCSGSIVGEGGEGEWHGDTYTYGHYKGDGETDSLYSIISPNPVVDNSKINYHIPSPGFVKISLMNSNFEEKVIIKNAEHSVGDYEIDFNNSELPRGVNYYMIDLMGEQSFRYIKRFSVIK
jgi:hypothetical protein